MMWSAQRRLATSVLFLLCVSVLSTEDTFRKACCKWQENTGHATITNQTEKSMTTNQSECCWLCMKQQLNDNKIKIAIYAEPYCYCMIDSQPVTVPGYQRAVVHARVLSFIDSRDNFEPSNYGYIYINFCAKDSGSDKLELLSIDLTQIQNYTDVMYFYTNLQIPTILHPQSKKIVKIIPPIIVDNGIIKSQILQKFMIGAVNKTTDLLLAFIHTTSNSITFRLKPFTVINVPKRGFAQARCWRVDTRNSLSIKCTVSNDHSKTNVDLSNVFVTIYYDNKTLLGEESTIQTYTKLAKYGVHPIKIEASMDLGASFDVTSYFKHLPNAIEKLRANVFAEIQSPKYKKGSFKEKHFYQQPLERPYAAEIKAKIYTVYFLYLSYGILYCYHDQFRTNNFCGIYDLQRHEIFVLPTVMIEPIGYSRAMQELYFYNIMGRTLVYNLQTQLYFFTKKDIPNDLDLPSRYLKTDFHCCGYVSSLRKFDQNTTVSATEKYWRVNRDVVVVMWP